MQLLELAICSALIIFAVYLALVVLAAVGGLFALVGHALVWLVALALVLLCMCVEPSPDPQNDDEDEEDDRNGEEAVSGSCPERYTPLPRCVSAEEVSFARVIDTSRITTIKWGTK